jgi:hypothetical protein
MTLVHFRRLPPAIAVGGAWPEMAAAFFLIDTQVLFDERRTIQLQSGR